MENYRILVVDNEPDFVEGLTTVLEARSYQMFTADSRSQAEAMTLAQRPDLIILGTIMPRGHAFLFHKWVKQTPRFGDVPIIVIDAPAEKQLLCGWCRTEGMQCEAEDYISKPVNVASLVPLIEKLLDRATRRIKVLVADDHTIVREGIRAVLSLQRDMQVIGEAVNGQEALEKTVELSPDVVLMDIVMPVMNGLEATKRLCRECPLAKVLILTQYDDEQNILASEQAGALGFIPKTAVSSQLLAGIRSVNQGIRFARSVTQ
jgi:DNA-binding NarL/FixJ family response regulator